MRRTGPPTPRQTAWANSARFREIGRSTLKRLNAARALLPRCSATARTTGEPCRQPAMENGKCRFHGGKTPRGDAWHKPAWPKASSPDAADKLNAKLHNMDRAATARKQRLARMSPEERAAHESWQRTHKPGSAAGRKRSREERRQNREARASIAAGLAESAERERAVEMDRPPAGPDHDSFTRTDSTGEPTLSGFEFDDFEDFDDDRDAVRQVLFEARSEGLRIAYAAAKDLAENPKTPAAARASAAKTLFEIGGLLNQRDRTTALEPQTLQGLSPAQLDRLARLYLEDKLSRERADEPDDPFK